MTKPFKDRTFAIVDVETTGGSPLRDRIIEIAILRIENGVLARTYQTLLDPECSIPPMIQSITGIRPEDLEGAPTFSHVARDIEEILSGAVFVAHNARFDYNFVKGEFRRLERRFSAKCLCSVRLSRALYPAFKRHDLSSLIERHDLPCAARHRAHDDARAVWEFMLRESARDAETFDRAVHSLLGRSVLSQHITDDIISAVPETSGVYIFYGPDGEVLYVGKSVYLRSRVASHFSSDGASSKELAITQQTASVEVRTTAGELGALILESELIKKMYPLYNRVSRKRQKLVLAKEIRTAAGFKSAELSHIDRIDPEEFNTVLGVFKSAAQAKKTLREISIEHGLCERIMGIESGISGRCCFGFQIGKCLGACGEREDAETYNARFDRAFSARRIRTWPYDGPIVIEERGEEFADSFIIDNWCLIGKVRTDASGNVSENPGQQIFDYDTYKILSGYISKRANARNIKKVPSAFHGSGTLRYESVIE